MGLQCNQHTNPDGVVSLLQRGVTMVEQQQQRRQQHLALSGPQEEDAHQVNLQQFLTPGDMSNTTSLVQFVKNLASAHVRGELNANPITAQVLADMVKKMEENVINVTLMNHHEDQREMNRSHTSLVNCTTAMQASFSHASNGVDFLKTQMEAAKTTHNTCRGKQKTMNATQGTSCQKFKLFDDSLDLTKPTCACSFPASPSAQRLDCMQKLEVWSRNSSAAYITHRDACNTASTNLGKQKALCDNDQGTFETAFCSYGLKLTDTCSTYASCRATKYQQFLDVQADVKRDEAARKIEYTAAKQVICYVGVLNATANSSKSVFEACQNATYSTSSLNINYPNAPVAAICDVTPVDDRPCSSNFLSIYYDAKTWVNKAPYTKCNACSWGNPTPTPQPTPTPTPQPTASTGIPPDFLSKCVLDSDWQYPFVYGDDDAVDDIP